MAVELKRVLDCYQMSDHSRNAHTVQEEFLKTVVVTSHRVAVYILT